MSCLKPTYILDMAYKSYNRELLERMSKYGKHEKNYVDLDSQLMRIPVPCGKCINCLMAKKQMWMYRVDCETRTSKSAYFYTLTYDDLISPPPALGVNKVHAQNFMKYLRAALDARFRPADLPNEPEFNIQSPSYVRFYLVGEYGGKYRRPHYHVLLWFPNMLITKDVLTPIVQNAWKHGNISDGYIEQLSASYCAKDMLKLDDPELYEACKRGYLNEPFHLFSRRPGIGGLFAEQNKAYFSQRDPQNCVVYFNGRACPLPRYFRSKYFPEREWNEILSKDYQSSKPKELPL